MAFWIFKCNPKMYRLSDRLAAAQQNREITWLATKYRDEMGAGDTAFIVQTGKPADEAGLRAVMSIDRAPTLMAELASERTFNVELDEGEQWRVKGHLTQWRVFIPREELREAPGLEELSIFSPRVFPQGTNFRVTAAEGATILRMIAERGGQFSTSNTRKK